ncbi:transposase [Chitinispirillum alkaliphilum]|nr:transposase [Chitinispirillum alkaliphilum]
MEKIDARKLDTPTRIYLKSRAKELQNADHSYNEISTILGVHPSTIARWLHPSKGTHKKAYKIRGRRVGQLRTLSPQQEKEIRELIRDKTPEQLKLPFALWTRKSIRDLICRRIGIKIPIRTIGEYLKRWGYTPQRPLKKAYEQRPAEVKKWLDETYPKVLARAKQEKAEIHWGDETGVTNELHYGRSYSPVGVTPVTNVQAKRLSTSMISSITNQGKVRFMIYKGAMNVDVFKRFLGRLIKGAKKKIFLVVDNLRVHHAKALKKWLEKNKEHIELIYLPSYSPERNPDEYLNNDLKIGLATRSHPKTFKEMHGNIMSHMRMLQKSPEHVKSFFEHPAVKYAA